MNGEKIQNKSLSIGDSVSRRGLFQQLNRTAVCASVLPLGIGATSSLLSHSAVAEDTTAKQPEQLTGTEFHLDIGYQTVNISGSERRATTINGSLPGPTLHWKEGETVTLHVSNRLDTTTSIHWHGLILPTDMDGVPGLSFDGIAPGATFTYTFKVQQSGTYWYHSHSGFQEQAGVYGAIVIAGKDSDPVKSDREHVIMLSDWSDQAPESVYATLKKVSHYYNRQERTLRDTFADIKDKGFAGMWAERKMWNTMRMSDRDIADVTGYTYHYLLNGKPTRQPWEGLFSAGETVRLRFINASAMTLFDVRMPGLKLTIVAADGQPVKPVVVDEFRIGTAETYDVLVTPTIDKAFTLFAQSIDRSGSIWGSLTPRKGLAAEVPAMDKPPVLTHADMGMDHGSGGHEGMDHGTGAANAVDHSTMDHTAMDQSTTPSSVDHSTMDHTSMNHGAMSSGQMDPSTMDHSGMDHSMMGHADAAPAAVDHSTMDHTTMDHSTMNHGGMDHSAMNHDAMTTPALDPAGFGSTSAIEHPATEQGPQVDMQTVMPVSGIDDPGIGLRHHEHLLGRKVLTYADLKNYFPTHDKRQPSREIQLHLTGNMARYMWSFNGVGYADAEPLRLKFGERVRITLVNDTMMTHPIHLHGLWSELETGDPDFIPRKHTILVQPGKKVSYLVTADAEGRWAYHCHLLYHMAGMMREVRVEV